jgi:hypothetical protein
LDEIFVCSRLSGNKLISTVSVPKSLRKYFRSFRLIVNYDASLRADLSILNIPLVSTVLPLAWLTGVDVRVEKLDRNYVEAMSAIKHEFNLTFPRGKFTSRLIVDDLVENQTQSQGTALLFSGGVDSTYSLVRNVGLKPRLVMFFGVVGYQLDPSFEKHNQLVKKTYSDFARREGFDISFIDTNVLGILNGGRISHDFYKILRGHRLWESLQLPLVLLGLSAPISVGRFNRVIIAADESPTANYDQYPYASRPGIIDKFVWASTSVTLDGYVDRFSKTNLIAKYIEKHEYALRVCNDPPLDRLNCSVCEKCSRTIVPLILEGVNPNVCGFEVNRSTFEQMRYNLEKRKFESWLSIRWKKAQDLLPCKIENHLDGSREFFLWLRNLNISAVRRKRNLQKDLSNLLPYPLAVLFDTLCYSVHNHSVARTVTTLPASLAHVLRRSNHKR